MMPSLIDHQTLITVLGYISEATMTLGHWQEKDSAS